MTKSTANLKKLDYIILLALLVLLTFGLLAVYSATQNANPLIAQNFSKQLMWVATGLVVLIATILLPIQLFQKYAYSLYALSILLLLLVLFIGSGAGVKRWLLFGPFRFQPAELAKIMTIFALARFVSHEQRNLNKIPDIALSFLIVIVPMLLIIKEPDLGTALVFPAMILPILFWAGLSLFTAFLIIAPLLSLVAAFNLTAFFLVMGLIIGVMVVSGRDLKVIVPNFLLNVSVGIVTPLLWEKLHKYQQSRILTFLGIEQDPRGIGYQVLQSKVAIGSGGFWGKGLGDGTQTQLRFLPEQHTDFIFSVIGEEIGFFGAAIVLVMFFILIWRALKIASDCKSRFASLVVVGAAMVISFHVLVNTGMTVGIMPVTGLPLPFLSYGGSAMVSNMVLVGLILNAGIRRFHYF
ncbi:MAG: rod shape-determining protein RodA [bacterium]